MNTGLTPARASASAACLAQQDHGSSAAWLSAVAAAAVLGMTLAGPAHAQSSGSQAGGSGSPPATAQARPSGQQASQGHLMGQEKLRQQLTQAGFREVQILDTAYLVRAQTQDGHTVLMMIDPPGTGTRVSGSSASTSGASGGTAGSASSGGGSHPGQGSSGRTQ